MRCAGIHWAIKNKFTENNEPAGESSFKGGILFAVE